MALQDRQKNRLRNVIRVTMVTIALLLLFWALVLPIINNAIALGVENELKDQPLPPNTQLVDSISAAGRFSKASSDILYFGALLVKSDLTEEEMQAYLGESNYDKMHNCTVEKQTSATILPNKPSFAMDLSFDEFPEGNCYIIYKWGNAPGWARFLLNSDTR